MVKKKGISVDLHDEEGIVQKMIKREYEGNFYRTYSFIDLLSLV